MMGVKRQSGDRSLGRDVHYVRSAAAVEAVTLGHPEVDVDHLLLGLLAIGGPSAQLLAGAGVSLGAARRAVTDVQTQDLRGLGITAAPQHRPVRAASRQVGLAVPVSGRAQDLLDTVSYRGDDRGLLLALLDDDGRRARRLLEHLGVDLGELRCRATPAQSLAGPPPAPEAQSPGGSLRGPVPVGTTWMEASYAQTLPVPAEGVWALISDPARRPEWDPTCTAVSVTADGVEQLTEPNGRVVTQTVIHQAPGRAIAWRRSSYHAHGAADTVDAHGTVDAARAGDVLQVVITPSRNGAHVHLRRVWTVRGKSWRLARPLLIRMIRAQLRIQMHGITQALA